MALSQGTSLMGESAGKRPIFKRRSAAPGLTRPAKLWYKGKKAKKAVAYQAVN
jgi:hypothetical protein